MLFIGVLAMFVPSLSLASDQPDFVYRCQDPSGTDLYTDTERPGCEVIKLPALTIAPDHGVTKQSRYTPPYGLRSFPSDWFDYAGSVGSLRNRLTYGGLYGMQDWLDYDAPVGSMRNSPANWPSPYLLYGWRKTRFAVSGTISRRLAGVCSLPGWGTFPARVGKQ